MSEVALIVGLVLAIIFIGLILSGLELAFMFALISIMGLLLLGDPVDIVLRRGFGGLDSFVLIAIPFFLLVGELMNKTQVTDDLFDAAGLIVGRFRGGLAHANIVASMGFAGISGSAVGDVMAIGSIFIPEMDEDGYRTAFSASVTAASAILGPIIPPSILIVIYAGITDASVGALFAAAIVPGILMGGAMMVAVFVLAQTKSLPRSDISYTKGQAPTLIVRSIVALTVPFFILGGILGGFFTPTEAAALAAGYIIVLGSVWYRSITTSSIYDSLRVSIKRTAQLFVIIALASPFSWLLSQAGAAEIISEIILSISSDEIVFLAIVMTVCLFVGTWLEITVATIIFGPLFLDSALILGVNPIHFAMVFLTSIQTGAITPPMGITLFAASSVSKEPVSSISRSVVPFFISNIATITLIILIPDLVLYVPRLLGF